MQVVRYQPIINSVKTTEDFFDVVDSIIKLLTPGFLILYMSIRSNSFIHKTQKQTFNSLFGASLQRNFSPHPPRIYMIEP